MQPIPSDLSPGAIAQSSTPQRPANPVPAAHPANGAPRPRSRDLTTRVAEMRSPRLALLAVVAMMFWPSLWHGFLLDDYRNLRLLEAYARGERPELGLYRFLTSTAEVQAERQHGYLPWWVQDDLRFSYFRPLTEAVIHAEFRLFGLNPLGYRLTGLLIYLLGTWAVLSLYRAWCGDELLARWSALLFTVAICNGVPVVFIAAQCDLLAMLLSITALLCATRFMRGGSAAWLALGTAVYAGALTSKEASVPVAMLPIGYYLVRRASAAAAERRPLLLRSAAAAGLYLAMALVLIVYHGSHGYGSNGELLLNPLREPGEYLRRMPGHMLMLLIGWLVPVNPLVTYLNGDAGIWLALYLTVGGAALGVVVRRLWRRCGRDSRLRVFALWSLVFLPLLACTNPDSRVMMLPTVGLSVVAAVWLLDRSDAPADAAAAAHAVRRGPLMLFLFIPFIANTAVVGALGTIQRTQRDALLAVADGFGRPAGRDDCAFVLNSIWQFDMLWCQDQLEYLRGRDAPLISYLGHVMHVRPERIDARTLRLTATEQPFFSTFLSRMGVTRTGVAPGSVFRTGEYDATVLADERGALRTVEFRFRDSIDAERYRFYTLDWRGRPLRWMPPAPAAAATGGDSATPTLSAEPVRPASG